MCISTSESSVELVNMAATRYHKAVCRCSEVHELRLRQRTSIDDQTMLPSDVKPVQLEVVQWYTCSLWLKNKLSIDKQLTEKN